MKFQSATSAKVFGLQSTLHPALDIFELRSENAYILGPKLADRKNYTSAELTLKVWLQVVAPLETLSSSLSPILYAYSVKYWVNEVAATIEHILVGVE